MGAARVENSSEPSGLPPHRDPQLDRPDQRQARADRRDEQGQAGRDG